MNTDDTTAHGIERITRLLLPLLPDESLEAQIEIYHAIAKLHPSGAVRQSAQNTCTQFRLAESAQLRFTELLTED